MSILIFIVSFIIGFIFTFIGIIVEFIFGAAAAAWLGFVAIWCFFIGVIAEFWHLLVG